MENFNLVREMYTNDFVTRLEKFTDESGVEKIRFWIKNFDAETGERLSDGCLVVVSGELVANLARLDAESKTCLFILEKIREAENV